MMYFKNLRFTKTLSYRSKELEANLELTLMMGLTHEKNILDSQPALL